MTGFIDIGHGVSVFYMEDNTGIYWRHPGCRSSYFLWFMPNLYSTGHRLVSGSPDDMEHFTIEGSLLCPNCGFHGFITNGRWIPA
jgi:hypothetical protein